MSQRSGPKLRSGHTEFATTAEIRNQIRKPLGGAGSGGIHNNNFKTNQNECLEFHDFHGVFWGLCCIIVLSLGWLDTFAK